MLCGNAHVGDAELWVHPGAGIRTASDRVEGGGQAATKMWLATSLGSSRASVYPSICIATYEPARQNDPVDPGKMPA